MAGFKRCFDCGIHYYQGMNAAEIKRLLELQPHPVEGGSFRRTYESAHRLTLADADLPKERPAGTAIYYLLEEGTFSEMHRLASDEIFHFYLGDPVEMLELFSDGTSRITTLGPQLAWGQKLQHLVPSGVWQGTILAPGGALALLGCTVTPGFDFDDYKSAGWQELAAKWPAQTQEIQKRTRS